MGYKGRAYKQRGCGVVRETSRVLAGAVGEVESRYDQITPSICMKFLYNKQNIIKIKFKN